MSDTKNSEIEGLFVDADNLTTITLKILESDFATASMIPIDHRIESGDLEIACDLVPGQSYVFVEIVGPLKDVIQYIEILHTKLSNQQS